MTISMRTERVKRLTDDEKIKIITDIFNSPKETQEVKVVAHDSSIIATITEKGFYGVDSFLAARQFEKIFVKTGYYVGAFTSDKIDGRKSITFHLISKFKITSVNRSGEYWEDVKYPASCPNCDETETFKDMSYMPGDCRDITCPKCKKNNSVRSFYSPPSYEMWN